MSRIFVEKTNVNINQIHTAIHEGLTVELHFPSPNHMQ